MKATWKGPLGWARSLGLASSLLSGAACNEPLACTLEIRTTPTGTVTWSDGEPRVPDRIFVLYAGSKQPQECDFGPPAEDESASSFGCYEGSLGPAKLVVVLDQQRWDTPFTVTGDDCHADWQVLDVVLDPEAGMPLVP